jgi:hypothetical protein
MMVKTAIVLVAVGAATLLAGCATIGDRIETASASPPPTITRSSALTPTPGPAPVHGSGSSDVRKVDWGAATLPATFCDVGDPVTFVAARATGNSSTWGPVQLSVDVESTTYGDIDQDGLLDAAVELGCDNGGGTASGQLGEGVVVVRSDGQGLSVVGTITPQQQPADAPHITLLDDPQFRPGQLTVHEFWYRPTDATCCPSGEAETTWILHDHRLDPQPPAITS